MGLIAVNDVPYNSDFIPIVLLFQPTHVVISYPTVFKPIMHCAPVG